MIVLNHSPTLATRGIIVYGASTIFQTMTVGSRPFSKLENDCPSKIFDQFSKWKVTAQPRPFSKLENECPSRILDHFLDYKVTTQPGPFSKMENDCPYINNISMLPPNLGSNHFPFQ
jgi:serine/threonine protein kinase